LRPLTLPETISAIGGRLYGELQIPRITAVATDSRVLPKECLFFALPGEQFDGHDFVEQALESGAVAAVVSRMESVPQRFHRAGRLILVPDTLVALGRLAGWYRRQFAAQVIAVVGSNGKTTTKDMIGCILGAARRGRAARASFNNAVGVPLTLLDVEPADEFVVVEIGTNHPGEVAALGRLANPDMVVVTSIGQEHLEFLGDLAGVAREEFSILTCLQGRGFVAVHHAAAEHAPSKTRESVAMMTFGFSDAADLRATDLVATSTGYQFKVNGRWPYSLSVLGRHNVANALAAVAIANRFRLAPEEIARGLSKVKLPPMRLQRERFGELTLINDAYNANPSSVRTALAVIDEMPASGRRVVILGDMRELGDHADECHLQIGRDAGRSTVGVIIAVGSHAPLIRDGAIATAGTAKRIYAFPTYEALAEKIGDLLTPTDTVLIKASRAVRLERLVEVLRRQAASRKPSRLAPAAGA
jgi:UDP-N-acetylmuramoyl-tripeptide--D-alanyl-D-alanine ligase